MKSIVAKFQAVCLPVGIRALWQENVTVQELRQRIPRVYSSHHRRAGLDLMLGTHIDGSIAIHPGSSCDVERRQADYVYLIERLRQSPAFRLNVLQACHVELAKPGWTVTFHAIAIFQDICHSVWNDFFEAIFIIATRSLNLDARSEFQNDAVVDLAKDIQDRMLAVLPSGNVKLNSLQNLVRLSPIIQSLLSETLPASSGMNYLKQTIIATRSLDLTAQSNYQNNAVINLVKNILQSVQHFQHCLPYHILHHVQTTFVPKTHLYIWRSSKLF